ncbi:hypothetical protein GPECTOR_29g79 [Gonium pectorale]|uniref:phytol kinase n=1 Tax=Gonium pectorale TaxID=33097 RepID=A0A150GEQ5_GONPE|nr:hypothetical protein GPECTOR_29g79 [Gonium pectorale]|eukprot:KXZ48304.1 hypothetical protein GPECTOR_29g79 [Gonium pectorale]
MYSSSLQLLAHNCIIVACDLAMASSPDEEPQQRELFAALVAALEDSRVLEHTARAVLLHTCNTRALRALMPHSVLVAARGHVDLWRLHVCWSYDAEDADAVRIAARLRAVASGRCVQHAARCMGLAVLCDADGGSAYGLPPEVLALLHTEQSPAGGEMSDDAVMQLRAMACMMQLGDPAPPGRRGALALAMRVGWLAVASARARAAGEGGGGGGASSSSGALPPAVVAAPRPRRSVPQEAVVPLAADALRAAWHYLALPRAVAQAVSAAAVAEAADWWRLAAAVVDRAAPCSTGDAGRPDLLSLGDRLAVAWGLPPDCVVLSLPAEPPPTLAAALDGGLLRCLERLMRRAGRYPQRPEATLLQRLVQRVRQSQSVWSYLAPLLAYGEPRQAAALLATLRKLLRTVDSRALGAEDLDPEANLHDCILTTISDVLAAVVEQEEELAAAAAPGAEPPSPASQQLLGLVSCAACEWLPELSQSLSQLLLSNGMASPGR